MTVTTRDRQGTQVRGDGLPVLEDVGYRIGTLERRRRYLEGQNEEETLPPKILEYNRQEIEALRVAVLALRVHRALVERGAAVPVAVLHELVEAAKAMEPDGSEPEAVRFVRAREAAERALAAWAGP